LGALQFAYNLTSLTALGKPPRFEIRWIAFGGNE
jgi:hypothetical protein